MAIDFGKLVLAPAMHTFAIPLAVTPKVSQPNAASYAGRGIWTVRDVDVILEDGATVASKSYELGIRLADFSITPLRGDSIAITDSGLIDQAGGVSNFLIDAVRPDGQGGARLMLKALQP